MSLMSQIKAELKRGASAANLQSQRIAELRKSKMERKKQALLIERKKLAEKKEYLDLQDAVRSEKSAIRGRQINNLTRFLPKKKTQLKTKARANLSKNTKSEAWSIGRQTDNPWQSSSSSKKMSPWDNPFK
jgi:hypothetical protein